MEEKRVGEELKKHVCRLCNKKYPSGKSLGGHMRSHAIANSNASSSLSVQKLKFKKALAYESNKNGVTVTDVGGDNISNGYGLRENPRKTWRVVTADQERVCKQCGKSFQSLKALCGHMRSHSDKERNFSKFKEDEDEDDEEENQDDEDNSWDSEKVDEDEMELKMESCSEDGRYKEIDVINSFSAVNGCSSNSSGVEHEQEELAFCLMMLSRDSGNRVGFNFIAESSDNNSAILGGGSSSTYLAKRKYLNFSSDNSNNNHANGSGKVKCVELDNSDSGYFENGTKELESDDSVDGYVGNFGIKKPKVDYGSQYTVYDSGFGYRSKNIGNFGLEKTGAERVEGDEEGNHAQLKKNLMNRVKSRSGFGGHELYGRNGSKNFKNDDLSPRKSPQRSSHKAGKFQYSTCQKSFKTHQSLGGHVITHRKEDIKNGNHNGENENNIDASEFASKHSGKISISRIFSENVDKKVLMGSKKTKGHCCPFCPKVFRSGQALGGHKRSHLIGCSSQDKADMIKSVEENRRKNHHRLLDLNLPAPVEEGDNGDSDIDS